MLNGMTSGIDRDLRQLRCVRSDNYVPSGFDTLMSLGRFHFPGQASVISRDAAGGQNRLHPNRTGQLTMPSHTVKMLRTLFRPGSRSLLPTFRSR